MSEREYLVTIPDRLDDADARELLELILAAASIELSVRVVFAGDGARLLESAQSGTWLQLAEQNLAQLVVLEDGRGSSNLPALVQGLDRSEFDAMRASSVEIRA